MRKKIRQVSQVFVVIFFRLIYLKTYFVGSKKIEIISRKFMSLHFKFDLYFFALRNISNIELKWLLNRNAKTFVFVFD